MAAEKRKIMIVDDDLNSLMVTDEILQSRGYDVVKMLAPHGCSAKIAYERPDILLLDVKMPRLAIDDLIDTLHCSPETEGIIVVLYSDMDAQELEQICVEKDLNGYFCKSMDLNQLPDFIDQFFN